MVGISQSNDNNVTSPVTPPINTPPVQTPPIIPTDTPVNAPEDLDSQWTRWKCSVCNYTYEGRVALKKCPRCGNEDPDKFTDAD